MAYNEEDTKTLFAEILQTRGYTQENEIIVDREKSRKKEIDDIFRYASKKKDGRHLGRPDFIIVDSNSPENVMVVECKAVKHSDAKKQALWYAKFVCSAGYNAIVIAVSGTTKETLKISSTVVTFEQYNECKKESSYDIEDTEYKWDDILRIQDYNRCISSFDPENKEKTVEEEVVKISNAVDFALSSAGNLSSDKKC